MTLEQQVYQHIRQLGYWDCMEAINPTNQALTSSLAWSNPNTTSDPETMFQLIWLLSSSTRRKRLNLTDLRIVEGIAVDLASDRRVMPATKTYVKYLWQQVYCQEFPQQLATGEFF